MDTKTKVRSKTVIYDTVFEHASHFSHLGCNLTNEDNKAMNINTERYQNICGTTSSREKKGPKQCILGFIRLWLCLHYCMVWNTVYKAEKLEAMHIAKMKFLSVVQRCIYYCMEYVTMIYKQH